LCKVMPDDGSLSQIMQHWMTNIEGLCLTAILHLYWI